MKIKQKKNIFLIKIVMIFFLVIFLVWFFANRQKPVLTGGMSFTNIEITTTAKAEPTQESTLSPNETIQAAVLMYHHTGDLPEGADDIRKGLTVSGKTFDSEMKKLKDGGYNVMTLNELYNKISTGVPDKAVVLTFDDGYDDNSTVAEPILQKYGFHGTFFIITGKVGMAEYMSEDQIKDLAKAGNEIGSHTVHHIDLSTVQGTTLNNEIKDSKTYLEKLTGLTVETFCYPSGKFSDEAKADLLRDGYKIAVTTEASKGVFSTGDLFEIPRYRVNPGSSLSFLGK
ncbi:MAG: polysaccharide deacetylase family protein [Candidatus Berkelbacteria bacterium]|nr:polysaccharide deacetylase family protein [Candidatus Berkelbacteria bacterium]